MRRLRWTLLIAAVIGFVAAFVLNQGVIAIVVALGALAGGVSRAIAAIVRPNRAFYHFEQNRWGHLD
jgi:hypothetical protein